VTGVGGSSNQWQTQQQAYLARRAGIHVVAVGAGRWLDRYELDNVVTQPRTVNAIFADSFRSLSRDATAPVRNIICNSAYTQSFGDSVVSFAARRPTGQGFDVQLSSRRDGLSS